MRKMAFTVSLVWLTGVGLALAGQAAQTQPALRPAAPPIMFQADAQNTAHYTARGVHQLGGQKWAFRAPQGVASTPILVGRTVYVGCWDGKLYALDADNGQVRWTFDTGGTVISTPAVAEGIVVFGGGRGFVHGVDAATGKERWRFGVKHGGRGIPGSATIVGRMALISSHEGTLYALHLVTGKEIWSSRVQSLVKATPAVADGQVFLGSYDRHLYAFDLATGRINWSIFTKRQLICSPVVAEGTVYVAGANRDGMVLAVDAATGQQKWLLEVRNRILGSMAYADGVLYAGNYSGHVIAIDVKTHKRKWTFRCGRAIRGCIAVADGIVYVGCGNLGGGPGGLLFAIDAATGKEAWRFDAKRLITSGVCVADGVVFFGCNNRRVYALAEKPLAVPATRPEVAPTLKNSVGMPLVYIKPGVFRMGAATGQALTDVDEEPAHAVTITRGFYMGVHEVTVGQFRAFVEETAYRTDAERGGQPLRNGLPGGLDMGDTFWNTWHKDASWTKPGFPQNDQHPVVMVSHSDAVMFCRWLSAKEGRTYRLPTEAEWEYACRAGTNTLFWWGNQPAAAAKAANTRDLSFKKHFKRAQVPQFDDGQTFTAPVGSYRANPWGLHDMSGNVWEWCADWYGTQTYADSPLTDPAGPVAGTSRVLRGGAWITPVSVCRPSYRGRQIPSWRTPFYGFRVVCEPDQ